MKGKFRSTVLVMISAIINSVFVTLFTLIYNYLVIRNYGSQVTGLISTLGQFVALFTIIEGGFSVAAIVASYEPIIHNDYEKLNNILYTAKKYFQKITIIFISTTSVLGIIYLRFIQSPLSSIETLSLLFVTILTTSFSINYVSRYSIVLAGHNSQYITVFLSTISRSVTWILSIILILNKANIIVVYSFNLLFVVIHSVLLRLYEQKHYPQITYKGVYKKSLIEGTNDILFQKVTATIFTSTDLVLISAGINLVSASVYYVYNQIFQAIYQYLTSICNAPSDSFGIYLKQNRNNELTALFCIYQKSVQIISSVFFLTAGLTIIPFVKLYTNGVNDANYVVPSLAICLFSYYYLKLNNLPFGLIINTSGNFKLQNRQCLIAAIVNILASVIFMRIWGVQGVVLGSILGTLIMAIMNIVETLRNIIIIKKAKFVFVLILNYAISSILIIFSIQLNFEFCNYFWWILYLVVSLLSSIIIIIIFNYLLDRYVVKESIIYLLNKVHMIKQK